MSLPLDLLNKLKNDKKTKIIAVTVFGAVTVTGFVVSQANAYYAVHDSKVYAQIVKQIKKATETIEKLQTQIEMQKKNMQDLSLKHIKPITDDIDALRKQYSSVKGNMSSLFNGTKDSVTAFKENFQSFENLDFDNMTYAQVGGMIEQNRAKYTQLNQEATTLINAKQAEIAKHEEAIRRYQELLPTAQGQYAQAKLQNAILTEQNKISTARAEIQAIQTKQATYRSELENLEKKGATAMNQKAANDFQTAGQAMSSQDIKYNDLNIIKLK